MPPPPSDNFPNQAPSLLPSDASSRRALRTQRSITNYSRARTQERPPQPTRSTAKDMKAALQLDFIVIGAGVSGLATAYALAQSGHRVRIYEKREAIHNRAVGVRVPPNMSKILYDWGLHDQLSAALKCRKSAFHSIEDNQVVGFLEWQEDVIKETGGDFLLMHHHDLCQMLYDLALSTGVTIIFDAKIESVSFDSEKDLPVALLEDGTVLAADLIVGADGHNSIVRETVTGLPDNGVPSGRTYLSIIVPAETMKQDPDWAQWLDKQEWPMWMGDGRVVLGYPVRGGKEYCIHAYWPETDILGPDEPESWDAVCPTRLLQTDGCHPSIARIFTSVPEALRTKFVVREALDDWVDESGTILLIGEAAHAFMPFTIHNASLAVEDAAVLGVLFSHLRSREQIAQILEAYQELRLPRVKHVQESELSNAALVSLPPGEMREMRNAAMGKSLVPSTTQWDDDQLREQWDEIGGIFGYNGLDAAEDWWMKWGTLGDSHRAHHQSMDFTFQVTQVAVSEL